MSINIHSNVKRKPLVGMGKITPDIINELEYMNLEYKFENDSIPDTVNIDEVIFKKEKEHTRVNLRSSDIKQTFEGSEFEVKNVDMKFKLFLCPMYF